MGGGRDWPAPHLCLPPRGGRKYGRCLKMIRARWLNSHGRRFDHAQETPSGKVLADLGQFHLESIARAAIGDKNDGIPRARDAIAAEGQPVDLECQPCTDMQWRHVLIISFLKRRGYRDSGITDTAGCP